VAAEELGVGWENISQVVQASTSHPNGADSITSGSNSVTSVFQPLRQAAATLYAMLAAEAAAVLGRGDQRADAGRLSPSA
jgi:CO/xanthine dehydrogenase Mo-binding subunit